MTKTRGWVRAGAMVAAVLLTVSACSDDKKAETTEQFMARVQKDCPSFQPGFDQFYTDHPEPTTADYVEFLPTQISGLKAMSTCVEQSKPPAAIKSKVQDVVDAMNTVVDDFQKALDAAKADDMETTDKWLTQMHDVDVDKIGQAMAALDPSTTAS